jgi:hypothetical protein
MESSITQTEFEGTNVRQFLAHRGSVVVKEFREIGKLKGKYGDIITVTTLILAIVKGMNRKTSYGVKLERTSTESYSAESSVLLDFDELHELMEAFDFINSLAANLKPQKCDHTEVVYSTKDNAQFGFYQDNQQQQQAFIIVSSHGETTFLDLAQLVKLKELLLSSQNHLINRGAEKDIT